MNGTSYRVRSRGVPLPGTAVKNFEVDTGDLNKEGRVIPVLFGTKRLKTPQLYWYGDHSTVPKLIIATGPPLSTGKRGVPQMENAGENYIIGMHLVYCMGPIDSISSIHIGDILISDAVSTGGFLNLLAILGDIKKGAISGTIEVAVGTRSQSFNTYLYDHVKKYGAEHPNYSGLFGIIAQGITIGTEPNIQPWEITAKRIHLQSDGTAQWYDAKAEISGDMNPAHIIREVITSKEYGAGYSAASFVDNTSFTAAADTLYTEGLGLSYIWEKETLVEDMIAEVEKTINGKVYFDRTIGKFKLKLIRDDYDIGTLLTADDTNSSVSEELKRDTNDELPNSISLNYWNMSDNKEASVTIRDTALSLISGGIITEKIDMMGITTDANACAVASRELLDRAFPKTYDRFYGDSSLSVLNPGDPFIRNMPDQGIVNKVFRIIDINIGSFKDRKVLINAVEDNVQPFGSIFTPPPATEWVPVSNPPAACPYRLLADVPLYILRRWLNENELGGIPPDKGVVMYTGTKPTNDSINAAIKIDAVELPSRAYFAPTGTITTALSKTDLTVVSDIPNMAENYYCQIDDEIVGISSVVDNGDDTYTLGLLRGCMDTVPQEHLINARLISLGYVVSDMETKTGTVSGYIAPQTLQGLLPWASAPEDTTAILATAGRHNRPIAPGNVQIGGAYWPASVTGDIVVTWEPRNRLNVDSLIDFYDTGIASEDGVTYSIDIYDHDDNLVYSVSGLTGTSHTVAFSDSDELLRLELYSVRDGVESWQKQIHEFVYTEDLGYVEGEFTASLEQVGGTVTAQVKYIKYKKVVHLFIPAVAGTSDGWTLFLGDLPELLTPVSDIHAACTSGIAFLDEGNQIDSGLEISIDASAHQIFFSNEIGGWTASGTKGIGYPINVVYTLF